MIEIRPVSYSTTYVQDDIEVYLGECEEHGIIPSQDHFNKWSMQNLMQLVEDGALCEMDFARVVTNLPAVKVFVVKQK